MKRVEDRFLKYVKIDTQSDPSSESFPSTAKQVEFMKILKQELEEIGLSEVKLDQYGYLTATIESNIEKEVPVVGFIAHVDTSPDLSGKNVNPQIVKYSGGDIVLNRDKDIVMRESEFSNLSKHIGHTLITTDGTTLLGADDKAGVAEIITAAEYLVNHPEIKHGKIKIGFTPDEEIGRGDDHFDVEGFGANVAYTIDGGTLGEIEYENFNAAYAVITVVGSNIHPGYAKDKMKNSFNIGYELHSMLPVNERPEYTAGYEGFFHLMVVSGSVETATFEYIIRDFDSTKFEKRKELMFQAGRYINEKYGEGTIIADINDQYYNMIDQIKKEYHVVDKALDAMAELGIEPDIKPIRGGTDGSRLSFKGLPCPNLFAGGVNFHGKYEYVSVETMNKAVELIVEIAKKYAK